MGKVKLALDDARSPQGRDTIRQALLDEASAWRQTLTTHELGDADAPGLLVGTLGRGAPDHTGHYERS